MYKKLFGLGVVLIAINTVANFWKDSAVIDYTIAEGKKASQEITDGLFGSDDKDLDSHAADNPGMQFHKQN